MSSSRTRSEITKETNTKTIPNMEGEGAGMPADPNSGAKLEELLLKINEQHGWIE